MVTGGSGASWPSGDLRAPGLEPHEVRLVEMDLCGLLDHDDAVVVRDARRERIQQRRLAGAGAARDQDVLLRRDRGRRACSPSVGRQRADVARARRGCTAA